MAPPCAALSLGWGMTVIELITDALRLTNIIDGNEVPDAEQGVSGMRALNDLMSDWEEDGIRLGWTVVTDQSDEVPVAPKNYRALRFNLAIELAGAYGIEPSAWVSGIANTTHARLAKSAQQVAELSVEHLPSSRVWGDITTG